MFRQPAWAVGNYSSSPLAAGTVGTKSTGGFFSVQNGHSGDVPSIGCVLPFRGYGILQGH